MGTQSSLHSAPGPLGEFSQLQMTSPTARGCPGALAINPMNPTCLIFLQLTPVTCPYRPSCCVVAWNLCSCLKGSSFCAGLPRTCLEPILFARTAIPLCPHVEPGHPPGPRGRPSSLLADRLALPFHLCPLWSTGSATRHLCPTSASHGHGHTSAT